MNEEITYEYVGKVGDDQYFSRSDGEFGPVRLINANAIPLVNVMFPVYSYYGKKIDTKRIGPVATKEDIDKLPTIKFPEAWWELKAFYEEDAVKVRESDGSSCTVDRPIREGWFCSRCGYIVSETGRPIEGFCGICGSKMLGRRDKKGEVRKR